MDLRGSLRGFGFVDCGVVWRSSLVRRVIGRIYCANWGDIVLDSERREMELVLCMSRLWIIIVVRTEGMWTWVGMKDCELNWSLDSVCRTNLGEYGELVGCEELARFLQKTY